MALQLWLSGATIADPESLDQALKLAAPRTAPYIGQYLLVQNNETQGPVATWRQRYRSLRCKGVWFTVFVEALTANATGEM